MVPATSKGRVTNPLVREEKRELSAPDRVGSGSTTDVGNSSQHKMQLTRNSRLKLSTHAGYKNGNRPRQRLSVVSVEVPPWVDVPPAPLDVLLYSSWIRGCLRP